MNEIQLCQEEKRTWIYDVFVITTNSEIRYFFEKLRERDETTVLTNQASSKSIFKSTKLQFLNEILLKFYVLLALNYRICFNR